MNKIEEIRQTHMMNVAGYGISHEQVLNSMDWLIEEVERLRTALDKAHVLLDKYEEQLK